MIRSLLLALFVSACAEAITPEQAASIIDEGATIASCQNKGRAAKDAGAPDAYGVYDGCMREAGVR